MALSVRLFGLSSWSILVPQALMGVASVGLLHATVRRTTRSAVAGLLAGAVLALTPVAVLMFRFDNPDALLVLLMVGSAPRPSARWSPRLRAEGPPGTRCGGSRWAVPWSGSAFLTKMLQAFLVLPALALVYLLAAHTPMGKRIGHLLVAFGSMLARRRLVDRDRRAVARVVAPLHRRVADQLHPRAHPRLQRLRPAHRRRDRLGRRRRRGGGGNWGSTGILRLFGSEIGSQVAWLVPAALILLVRRAVVHPPAPRDRPHPRRAGRLGHVAARHRR